MIPDIVKRKLLYATTACMVAGSGLFFCEKDNFPTVVPKENLNPSQQYQYVQNHMHSLAVHLDSVRIDSIWHTQVTWYGRVENKSSVSLEGQLGLYVKVYTDSSQTTLFKTPFTYLNLMGFDPGEFYYFQISDYIDTAMIQKMYSDSIELQ